MSDARWGDPREYVERDLGDERPRVYGERDRDDRDPRDGLMRDLDLLRGDERELVVDRDHVYELNGEDSRSLAAVGTFRVVPEQDLDIDRSSLLHDNRGRLVGTPMNCETRDRSPRIILRIMRRDGDAFTSGTAVPWSD